MRHLLQLHGEMPVDAYPAVAARAEQLGFEDVSLHDVLLRRPVWPVLCDIARATSRVLVGPDVTHPYLTHPAVVAANMAHLDDISGGRGVLGIGRGSMYRLVGMTPPGRLESLREAIALIRVLLSGGTEGYAGATFALEPGSALRFGDRRAVPVVLGALGPKGARLAGEVCDGLRVAGQWDPAYALSLREHVAAGAAAAGRDPSEVDFVVENWTYVHPDRERARRGARELLATFLPHLGPVLAFHSVPAAEVAAAEAVAGGDATRLGEISDRTVDLFMAAGDVDDLVSGLDRLAAAGVDAVSFSGALGPDAPLALEMIGEAIARRHGVDPPGGTADPRHPEPALTPGFDRERSGT